jgi:hypothetical protein
LYTAAKLDEKPRFSKRMVGEEVVELPAYVKSSSLVGASPPAS